MHTYIHANEIHIIVICTFLYNEYFEFHYNHPLILCPKRVSIIYKTPKKIVM